MPTEAETIERFIAIAMRDGVCITARKAGIRPSWIYDRIGGIIRKPHKATLAGIKRIIKDDG